MTYADAGSSIERGPDAWKQQFRKVIGVLRRRGQSREDAEDLVQEAFLRLHVFLEEGHEVRAPDSFLIRTALNLAVDARRRRVRDCRDQFLSETIEELTIADFHPTPEENVAAELRLDEMRRVLDENVSPKTREVFFLHRLEGFSHREIARIMGISLRSVEKRIARAMTVVGTKRRVDECHRAQVDRAGGDARAHRGGCGVGAVLHGPNRTCATEREFAHWLERGEGQAKAFEEAPDEPGVMEEGGEIRLMAT